MLLRPMTEGLLNNLIEALLKSISFSAVNCENTAHLAFQHLTLPPCMAYGHIKYIICPTFCTGALYTYACPLVGFSAALYTHALSMHTHGHANMHTDVLVDFFEADFGSIEDSPIAVRLTLTAPIATDLDVRIRMMNITQVFELTEGEVARRKIPLPDDFPDPGVFDSRRPYIASSKCPELMIGMA